MRMFLISALAIGGLAGGVQAQGTDQNVNQQAQGQQTPKQGDPNAPGVPPGDEYTVRGMNPEGQPYTPPGYNQGIAVYPPATAAPGGQPGAQDYPPCTRRVKDRCVQTYARSPQ